MNRSTRPDGMRAVAAFAATVALALTAAITVLEPETATRQMDVLRQVPDQVGLWMGVGLKE